MPTVKSKGDWENFESLLRRWKRVVDKCDTLKDAKKHEFYEKPSEIKKRARAAAKKRKHR